MQSRWNTVEAPTDPLEQCAYGSRLLGSDDLLVLHGGGNTSVKTAALDVTGVEIEVLHVKGSGYDLASIPAAGFVPLRISRLRELLQLERMTDPQMVNELRCARLDASAPDPSVEALLHALLPFPAVQHSHADAIVTLTNLADGEDVVRRVFGDELVVVPYAMPGFDLAASVATLWPRHAHPGTVGLVLMNHGLFTVGADTQQAYERHIALIDRAQQYLAEHAALPEPAVAALPAVGVTELVAIRRALSDAAGVPLVVRRDSSPVVAGFVAREDLSAVATRGPATPDHIIRTKRVPVIGDGGDGALVGAIAEYTAAYDDYVQRNVERRRAAATAAGREPEAVTALDPAPRVLLDPRVGMLTAGRTAKDAAISADIYHHTIDIIGRGELLGGYQALPEAPLFDVEYWDLEQAKLRRAGSPPMFAGQVALVTGAASGIGKACAAALLAAGAAVIGLDLSPGVNESFSGPAWCGVSVDVTDAAAVDAAIATGIEAFGGLDIVVVSAGVFAASAPIAELDESAWRKTMAVNVDSVATLYRSVHPLLAASPVGGRVAVIASKNVPAPGPGAAAYSASKAALTQLSRVAALEWAPDGIRVNLVHPDAVFDTGLWNPELLAERANRYGMTVQEYKRRNLLRTEVSSPLVAAAVVRLCSDEFSATTGAQVPIDGGSDRVV
ncbi:bifunctional aldolase/short-chain dehydrogenase [Nakamurella sp. A5-74]|uniref:Bifunctional aldolase/short-chain dehydrogenase n=1 Tax=Nakamurella sp. A5-74 TaxID=3158264 RepID=A0AAU8DUH7_9ACTN